MRSLLSPRSFRLKNRKIRKKKIVHQKEKERERKKNAFFFVVVFATLLVPLLSHRSFNASFLLDYSRGGCRMASRLTIRAKWSARRTQLHPDHKKPDREPPQKPPKQTHIFLLLLEIQERKLPPKTKNLAVSNPIETTRDKSPFCD